MMHVCIFDRDCWHDYREYGMPMRIYFGKSRDYFITIPFLSGKRRSENIWEFDDSEELDDWSDSIRIFHDFNDGNELGLYEGMIVFAGNSGGGMRVKLGRASVRDNGYITIPFTTIGEWMDESP